MKKLLVLTLVLSMATVANAGLSFTLSGPTSLGLGATGTYTIGYSGMAGVGDGSLGGFDIDILNVNLSNVIVGTVGNGAIVAANQDTGYSVCQVDGASLSEWGYTGLYEETGETITLATPVDMGSPLATFQFTAPGTAGTVNLSLLLNSAFDIETDDVSTGVTMGTVQVNVTPEPMTLAILGLGGLFLRRRK